MTAAEKQQLASMLILFIAACGGLLALLKLIRALREWRGR
jgi:hypothetical protein